MCECIRFGSYYMDWLVVLVSLDTGGDGGCGGASKVVGDKGEQTLKN